MTKPKTIDPMQALLAADLNIEKDVRIKRLGASLRIKALDSATLEKSREQATHGNRKESTFDNDKFKAVLITKMVVNVNFADPAMLQRYSASDAVDCVRKALLPGEIQRVSDEGLALSGFANDDETVEDDPQFKEGNDE